MSRKLIYKRIDLMTICSPKNIKAISYADVLRQKSQQMIYSDNNGFRNKQQTRNCA